MTEPMFLKPVFQEKIWGGDRLNTVYGYDISSDHTGECWAISAHKHGPATVINGPYKGLTLDEVWDKHREAFGNAEGDVFPLLTKILDAKKIFPFKSILTMLMPKNTNTNSAKRNAGIFWLLMKERRCTMVIMRIAVKN